ncbi:MAG: hypothetical protein LUQ28_12065 [Methylococcaceae bacterium]|nr:hypothetical protein [Methylococcaceae bacterium]
MAIIRSIGGIIPDVVVEETHSDEMEITQHPVQQGAAISDHAYKKPMMLKMSVIFGKDDINITYQKLLDLQNTAQPFDVVTGKRSYKNMMFKSLSVTTNKDTNSILSVNAELIEVIIVSVTVTNVPGRTKQKNAGKTGATEKAGSKQATPVQEEKKKSALRSLFG